MPLPSHALAVNGGCSCGAIRYKIEIPNLEERPMHPISDPSKPVHLPFIVLDHCNDCRRATGAILPAWLCTPISMITASLVIRSTSKLNADASKRSQQMEEIRGAWLPGKAIFEPGEANRDSFLTFYESSEGRRRTFCGRCGTNLSYAMFPTMEGWPDMLDMVHGTIDRDCLQTEALAPERQLWWDYGVNWVQKLSAGGVDSLPKHPNYKMNELID